MVEDGVRVWTEDGFWDVSPRGMKCALCRFFHVDHSECRINYPKSNGWPKVEADDWCGAFDLDEARLRIIAKKGELPPGVYKVVPIPRPEPVEQPSFFKKLFGGG